MSEDKKVDGYVPWLVAQNQLLNYLENFEVFKKPFWQTEGDKANRNKKKGKPT